MKSNKLLWLLQLFAGEGAGAGGAGTAGEGAEGAASGEMADAAGQQLRELGVPEDKIRRHRANKSRTAAPAIRNAEEAPQAPQQAAAAPEETEPTEEPKPEKKSWEEILKDPDYNREMQKTVQAAKSKSKAAEAAMEAMAPIMQRLATEHGMDPNNIDYVALSKSMNGEYANKAAELGVSEEIAMRLDQQERTLEQQRFNAHMRGLEQQAEDLKKVFPNLDFNEEMKNQRFFRMVMPGGGCTFEDAYHAIHWREIEAAKAKAITQVTQQQIANSIASGQRRPTEAGSSAQAPSVTTFDWHKASRQEREDMKARIRRGEKVFP